MARNAWGAHRSHGHLSWKNLCNASLCVFVLVVWKTTVDRLSPLCAGVESLCGNPIAAVTLFLLLDVSLLFWLIGLLQRSFWLIDPFWTWIPFMITYAFLQHPSLPPTPFSLHFYSVMGLLGIWSMRLTHSYFRREGWKFGEREDWRYTLLAQKCGRQWVWISFWAVGVVQQLMLTGLMFPVYSILFHPMFTWSIFDSLAVGCCGAGIGIAFLADNELHRYVTSKEKSEILRSGVWSMTRHPNYFGEQLFYWGLCFFSWNHGDTWTILGPLFTSLIFVETTRMTEQHMIQNWSPERVTLYRRYQKTTSPCIPWWNSWNRMR